MKWMEIAEGEIGQGETLGPNDSPRIREYFMATDLGVDGPGNPWCSAFMNWVMQQAGIERTKDAMARSWLHWGQKLGGPKAGAVVIFARGNDGISGHVGLVDSFGFVSLRVLGGNEDDCVEFSTFSRLRVLGYRWPPGVEIPA